MQNLMRAGAIYGPSFPNATNTGATITAPVTTVNVPANPGPGTNWTWNAGTSTVTATGNVSGLNITGKLTVSGASAVASNCITTGQVTLSGAGSSFVNGSTVSEVLLSASNTSVTGSSIGAAEVSSGKGNVLISNCVIVNPGGGTSEAVKLDGTNDSVTITDCTISGSNSGAGRVVYCIDDNFSTATNLLIQRCNLFWMRVGISFAAGTVRDCYIHDPGYISGDHTDGIGVNGTRGNVLIQHNTILVPLTQTTPIDAIPQTGSPPVTNITIDSNLLAGGGYAVYCGNGGVNGQRNWQITDAGCSITGGTTLNDTLLVAADAGATVTGTGIPAGTTISGVVVGTSATLSQACTNSGSVAVTFHYSRGVVITNNRFSKMYFPASGQVSYGSFWDSTVASNVWSGNVYHDDPLGTVLAHP